MNPTWLLLALLHAAVELESDVDGAVKAAIERKEIPGAVVLILRDDQVLLRKAYGNRVVGETPEAMTVDTIFDLASLTKPIATATAIHCLVQAEKLRYDDPVAKHWPAFAAQDKDKVTIQHLLIHTSGLIADNNLSDYADGREKAFERIAALKLVTPPGKRFVYSDVGYLVLGELVGRISGKRLSQFTQETIFTPLKMTDTGFLPPEALERRIAPTTRRGIVHDPRSLALKGESGHAGLFGTADDLARFVRMLLHGGELDGVRILKAESVDAFTEAVPVPGGLRSRGWDIDTAYSAPRGTRFRKGTGYGHTGFTGTSIWVDPASKTIAIVLTNRVHPNDKGNASPLRREIGTLSAP